MLPKSRVPLLELLNHTSSASLNQDPIPEVFSCFGESCFTWIVPSIVHLIHPYVISVNIMFKLSINLADYHLVEISHLLQGS